jgi:adenylyltransferase/sulfurtransferase
VGVVPTLPPLVGGGGHDGGGAARDRGVAELRALARRGLEGRARRARLFSSARPSAVCPVCSGKRFPALEGEGASDVVKLCGRRSVQVAPGGRERPDFDALERRLARLGPVRRSPHLLSAEVEGVALTLFSDGRCVVRGTGDPAEARALYAKYVGR